MERVIVKLEDLVGLHWLSGVSYTTFRYDDDNYDDSQAIHFVLDGKTYTAREDKNDGYRSAMEDIVVSSEKVTNRFPRVRVFCHMRKETLGGWNQYVLEMYDVTNAQLILEVGTEDVDDYYPSFVSNWMPQNMAANQVAHDSP